MVHFNYWWKQDLEPAVKSMSFVFMEPARKFWHNNGGKDFCTKFELPSATPQGAEGEGQHHHHHHNGKIGDVLNEIIKSETEYVRFKMTTTKYVGLVDSDA